MAEHQILKTLFSGCSPDSYITIWSKRGSTTGSIWMTVNDVLSGNAATAIEAGIKCGADIYTSTSTCQIKGQRNERIELWAKREEQGSDGKTHYITDLDKLSDRHPYEIPAFFMDIDTMQDPHKVEKTKELPKTPEEAETALQFASSGWTFYHPSFIVNSGHGLHAYWMLKQPITVTTPEDLRTVSDQMRRFAQGVVNAMAKAGYPVKDIDTHVSEPARVLRIDGTKNFKDPSAPLPVLMQSPDNGNRYTVEELMEIAAPVEAPKDTKSSTVKADKPDTPAPSTTGSMTDEDYFQTGLQQDDDFADMWNGRFTSTDDSACDLALMAKIYYWSKDPDPSSVINRFLSSPWVAQHPERAKKYARQNYLDHTYTKVMEESRSTAAEDDAEYHLANPNASTPDTAASSVPDYAPAIPYLTGEKTVTAAAQAKAMMAGHCYIHTANGKLTLCNMLMTAMDAAPLMLTDGDPIPRWITSTDKGLTYNPAELTKAIIRTYNITRRGSLYFSGDTQIGNDEIASWIQSHTQFFTHQFRSKERKELADRIRASAPEQKPRKLIPRSLGEVEEVKIRYLMRPYILSGDINILAAESGTGKSFFIAGLIAAMSNGGEVCPGVNVAPTDRPTIIITEEDNGSIWKMRIRLSGANMDYANQKVLTLGSEVGEISLDDPSLENMIQEYKPALLVFDPIQRYWGTDAAGREIDQNNTTAVRAKLAKLTRIARQNDCAVICIAHLNKKTDQNARNRIAGSGDIVNISRSVLSVFVDPENPSDRLVIQTKCNHSKPGKTIRYTIKSSSTNPDDGYCEILDAEDYTEKDYINALREAKRAASDDGYTEADYNADPLAISIRKLMEENPDATSLNITWSTLMEITRLTSGFSVITDARTDGREKVLNVAKYAKVIDGWAITLPPKTIRDSRYKLNGEVFAVGQKPGHGINIARKYQQPQQQTMDT